MRVTLITARERWGVGSSWWCGGPLGHNVQVWGRANPCLFWVNQGRTRTITIGPPFVLGVTELRLLSTMLADVHCLSHVLDPATKAGPSLQDVSRRSTEGGVFGKHASDSAAELFEAAPCVARVAPPQRLASISLCLRRGACRGLSPAFSVGVRRPNVNLTW